MKNIYLIIVVVFSLSIVSCSTLKHGDEAAQAKQRMQVDAYAMANIECEYKLTQLQLEDNKDDRKLRSQFDQLQTDITLFTWVINSRYRTSNDLSYEFNKMVKSAGTELTTCRQVKAIEEIREEEKDKVKD